MRSHRTLVGCLWHTYLRRTRNPYGNGIQSQGKLLYSLVKDKKLTFSTPLPQIDVWAAGIILYILLCGFPPFVSPDNQQEPLFDAILSGVFEFPEPYWDGIGEGVRDLINNMLQSDPDLRFSSEDVLDHFWLLDDGGQHLFIEE